MVFSGKKNGENFFDVISKDISTVEQWLLYNKILKISLKKFENKFDEFNHHLAITLKNNGDFSLKKVHNTFESLLIEQYKDTIKDIDYATINAQTLFKFVRNIFIEIACQHNPKIYLDEIALGFPLYISGVKLIESFNNLFGVIKSQEHLYCLYLIGKIIKHYPGFFDFDDEPFRNIWNVYVSNIQSLNDDQFNFILNEIIEMSSFRKLVLVPKCPVPIIDDNQSDYHTALRHYSLSDSSRGKKLEKIIEHAIFDFNINHFVLMELYRFFNRNDKNLESNKELLCDQFNKVSHLVVHDIVTAENRDAAAKIYGLYINVAYQLIFKRELPDFHGGYAVLSGLNNIAVTRLKAITNYLDSHSRVQRNLKRLDDLFSPDKNFSAYRNKTKKIKKGFIPAFPILMKDITFANEGNDNIFDKLSLSGKLLYELSAVHEQCLNLVELQPVSDFQKYIEACQNFSPDDCYEQSLKIQAIFLSLNMQTDVESVIKHLNYLHENSFNLCFKCSGILHESVAALEKIYEYLADNDNIKSPQKLEMLDMALLIYTRFGKQKSLSEVANWLRDRSIFDLCDEQALEFKQKSMLSLISTVETLSGSKINRPHYMALLSNPRSRRSRLSSMVHVPILTPRLSKTYPDGSDKVFARKGSAPATSKKPLTEKFKRLSLCDMSRDEIPDPCPEDYQGKSEQKKRNKNKV